ncbi:DUF5652 family protein [Nanoarchaeota archaeon]
MACELCASLDPGVGTFLIILFVVSIWSLIWKGIALWKCGRHNQLPWFVVLLILNTAGILPIIYLLFFQKKSKTTKKPKKTKKKK